MERKCKIFITLSNIDTAMEESLRPLYKAHMLLSCLSSEALHTVTSMGFTDTQLDSHTEVIAKLKLRCNAGRTQHVWRQQFGAKKQQPGQSADDWLCELRDLAKKSDFVSDCCANCQPTRILGQVIADEVRVKLLEVGATLNLDRALTILRTAEAAAQQSTTLKHGDAKSIQATSTYKSNKQNKASQSNTKGQQNKGASNANKGCWNCGADERCIPLDSCPARGRECHNCKRFNHFA